jgi:hypothetical protein
MVPLPSYAAIFLTAIQSVQLSDVIVDFLFVGLSCSSSRSTTARLIGAVLFSVLKMFHPTSNTAGTDEGVSIHTTK